MSTVELYHGSMDSNGLKKIRRDLYNDIKCKERQAVDFGPGFYLTPNILQAMEWSVRNNTDGSINYFQLNLNNLNVLNFDPKQTHPLHWIAEIIYNRKFKFISSKNYNWIINNWKINTDIYDIIVGYTIDDQYFSMFKDFLDNRLSFTGLCKTMLFGDLSYQYVVRTNNGYDHLSDILDYEIVYKKEFYQNALKRRDLALKNYEFIKLEHNNIKSNELFFSTMIDEKISKR